MKKLIGTIMIAKTPIKDSENEYIKLDHGYDKDGNRVTWYFRKLNQFSVPNQINLFEDQSLFPVFLDMDEKNMMDNIVEKFT